MRFRFAGSFPVAWAISRSSWSPRSSSSLWARSSAAVSSPSTLSRRSLDALAHLLEALPGVPGSLRGILADSQVDQLLRDFQCIGDFLLARLPDGVVQLLGQEGLALLRILDGTTHLLEQLIEPLFLLFKTFADLLSFARVAQ